LETTAKLSISGLACQHVWSNSSRDVKEVSLHL